MSHHDSPIRVQLSDERRNQLVKALKSYFDDHFDEPLSDFRAGELVEFFLRELGPPVYNQGVHDACAAMQEKLTDLEGEVYERDPLPGR